MCHLLPYMDEDTIVDIRKSTIARNIDITVTTIITATKAWRTCIFVGKITLSSSRFASLKKLEILEKNSMLPSYGRPRGTRTPDTWFWRPVLYQLSYWPILLVKREELYSFISLCTVCSLHHLQYFLRASFSVVFFLFLTV